jgi:hypothetical protein
MSLEERMAKFEGRLDEFSKRIDDLRNDLPIESIDFRTRSTPPEIGLLITMWVSIILTIFLKG